MNHKKNQHYMSTHQDIQNALTALLEANDLKSISVRQICETAGINRSTFYTHYGSIYDLWDELDSVLRVAHITRLDNAGIHLDAFLSPEGLETVLGYIYDHRHFYKTYLGQLGSDAYIKSAFEDLWEARSRLWKTGLTKEEMYFSFVFFMGGALRLIQSWIIGGCEEPISFIARTISNLIPAGLGMKSL